MNSQSAGTNIDVVELNSFIRGYHSCMDIWNPQVGETLILKREPENPIDVHAVAVLKEREVVGHMPYTLAATAELLLRRDVNKGFTVVTDAK